MKGFAYIIVTSFKITIRDSVEIITFFISPIFFKIFKKFMEPFIDYGKSPLTIKNKKS